MTFSVFRSTDPLAPSLTGLNGSLITVLDTCLVNGYTVDAWLSEDIYALNAVVEPTVSNGYYYKATVAGTADIDEPVWPTTAGNTVVDGTVTWTCVGIKPVALGWTKPFSGTNKAVYRLATTGGGSGSYLRVNDGIATYTYRAGVTGYVAMTTVDAGTDPFGTVQDYNCIPKSAASTATARAWTLVGDEHRFYLMTQPTDNIAAEWDMTFFGDIVSYVANDPYKALLGGRYSSSMSANTAATNWMMYLHHYLWSASTGIYMPRTHAAAGPAIQVGFNSDTFMGSGGATSPFYAGATGLLAYPNVVNSGIFMSPVRVHQATTSPYVMRGHMPGMWAPMHNRPLTNNTIFTGTGQFAGKTFEAFHVRNGGQLVLELSDTWS